MNRRELVTGIVAAVAAPISIDSIAGEPALGKEEIERALQDIELCMSILEAHLQGDEGKILAELRSLFNLVKSELIAELKP